MAQGLSITASQGPDPGCLTIALAGRMDAGALASGVDQVAAMVAEHGPSSLTLDLSGVDYLDSAGALAASMMRRRALEAGCGEAIIAGAGEKVRAVLDMVDEAALDTKPILPAERRLGVVEQVGQTAADLGSDFYRMMSFVGEFVYALGRALSRPRLVRWTDVAVYMEKVGVSGLPIVGLISFLLGMIIAFMSSLQLASFGANIYIASLVALGMVRELGPIMTAVIVAGRSGSSFAAEIGTMKVNQEVDALTVMGYDPVSFLALPKVLAAILTVPLLTLYSDFLGIVGGLAVGSLLLNITPYAYISKTMSSIDVFDIVSGLVKSGVFAIIIAGIGCQRGMTVRGGAQAVGGATTSAVVASMFWIIVTDSFFAILLHYVR